MKSPNAGRRQSALKFDEVIMIRLRLASRVFENAAEDVIVTDTDANILDINPGFT